MYYIKYSRRHGGTFIRKFKTLDELIKFEREHTYSDSIRRITNLKKYLTPYQQQVYKAKKDCLNRQLIDSIDFDWETATNNAIKLSPVFASGTTLWSSLAYPEFEQLKKVIGGE